MKSQILKKFFKICLIIHLILSFTTLNSQEYIPTKENIGARHEFQEAKFGMFIHWGIYSILGDGEWVMNNQKIPAKTYEKLADFFNPIDFNAKEWVSLAKDAGMKYITITSKHHDGFAMYDSNVSDYNIVDKTPYKQDIIKALSEECEKQGLQFYLYYSQLDWHHEDYFPRGRTGLFSERPETGNWNSYLAYQNAQIKELAENYKIDGFWFDGWWDQKNQPEGAADWNLTETYKMIHDINSALLIGNNHHKAPFAGEDFQMFEKDLPGHSTTGFATSKEDIGNLPLETCETINHSWGFNLQDNNHKSVKTLIQYIVKAAGYNANFLLNVGPMPNGKIQDGHVQTLKQVGKWMKEYGDTIYGSKNGPLPPKSWGVSTAKGNKIYIHVLDPTELSILISDFSPQITAFKYYNSDVKVDYQVINKDLIMRLNKGLIQEYDTILELTIK